MLWKEIKKQAGVPSVKVFGLKRLWGKKGYYTLKIIAKEEEKDNYYDILAKPNDIVEGKEIWMKVKLKRKLSSNYSK